MRPSVAVWIAPCAAMNTCRPDCVREFPSTSAIQDLHDSITTIYQARPCITKRPGERFGFFNFSLNRVYSKYPRTQAFRVASQSSARARPRRGHRIRHEHASTPSEGDASILVKRTVDESRATSPP